MRDFFLLLAWFVDTLVILKIKSHSFVLAGAAGLVFGFVYYLTAQRAGDAVCGNVRVTWDSS